MKMKTMQQIALASMLAFVLGACGGSSNSSKPAPPEPPEPPTQPDPDPEPQPPTREDLLPTDMLYGLKVCVPKFEGAPATNFVDPITRLTDRDPDILNLCSKHGTEPTADSDTFEVVEVQEATDDAEAVYALRTTKQFNGEEYVISGDWEMEDVTLELVQFADVPGSAQMYKGVANFINNNDGTTNTINFEYLVRNSDVYTGLRFAPEAGNIIERGQDALDPIGRYFYGADYGYEVAGFRETIAYMMANGETSRYIEYIREYCGEGVEERTSPLYTVKDTQEPNKMEFDFPEFFETYNVLVLYGEDSEKYPIEEADDPNVGTYVTVPIQVVFTTVTAYANVNEEQTAFRDVEIVTGFWMDSLPENADIGQHLVFMETMCNF